MKVDLLAGAAERRTATVRDRPARVVVFDSGLGGLTVHAEIARMMPGSDLVYIGDTAVFPYGRLSEKVLGERVVAVLAEAIATYSPDVVVIACNTASTLALPLLRARFELPFVGTVPAVKPAAEQSGSRCISVLATPGTVARDYTRELVAAHAQDCHVTLVGSERLAELAEAELNGSPADDSDLLAEITPAFVEHGGFRTDTVVLACTHYPLVLRRLQKLAPWPVRWIDSAPAIARRVVQLAGEQPASLPRGSAIALFTSPAPLPLPLQTALTARGFGKFGVLAMPLGGGTPC